MQEDYHYCGGVPATNLVEHNQHYSFDVRASDFREPNRLRSASSHRFPGAETDAAARRLFTTSQQRVLRLIRNQPVELLPPVDSMEPLWQGHERAAVESKLSAAIVGSDKTVAAGLQQLIDKTGADEVIVVTDTFEHADRLESYQRLATIAKTIQMRTAMV